MKTRRLSEEAFTQRLSLSFSPLLFSLSLSEMNWREKTVTGENQPEEGVAE